MTPTPPNGLYVCGAAALEWDEALLGGKGRGLAMMSAAGAPVPPFVVLPTVVCQTRPWRSRREIRRALESLGGVLAPEPDWAGLAVRSSSPQEDQANASRAGQYHTCFVKPGGGVAAAVEAVLDAAPEREPMAVVVQAAVDAACAGVAFSANPAAAKLDARYAEVVRGQGAALVDGDAEPTRVSLSAADGAAISICPGAEGPPALPEGLALALHEGMARLEAQFGHALDVEWAWREDSLWFLQARPITSMAAAPEDLPGHQATSWFFDQRFHEPIHPITRTALLPTILRVAVHEALAMRGAQAPEPLLSFHGGQAYVHHGAYAAMLRGAPWWFLAEDLRQIFPGRRGHSARIPEMAHYGWCAFTSVLTHAGPVFLNRRYWRAFVEALHQTLDNAPPASTPAEWLAAWEHWDGWSQRFLRLHRWSILWAGYWHRGIRLVAACLPRRWGSWIEERLWARARLVTAEANQALAEVLSGNMDSATFCEYYGDRSPSLDLAVPTWRELLEEGRLETWYKGHEQGVPPKGDAPRGPAAGVMAILLGPARAFLELREAQRFEWEHILARQRALLRDAGQRLHAQGRLERADDVWFLTWDELRDALEGGTPSPSQAAMRRHAHVIEQCLPTPPFLGPDWDEASGTALSHGGALRGIPAAPGRARGIVRVLRGPEGLRELDDGEAVVAVVPSLDPAWTALLRRASALVVERGGVLSHGAILAREYGVPMVIGAASACQQLKPGSEVEVDGDQGWVRYTRAGHGGE